LWLIIQTDADHGVILVGLIMNRCCIENREMIDGVPIDMGCQLISESLDCSCWCIKCD
jgi:hypothetical protein